MHIELLPIGKSPYTKAFGYKTISFSQKHPSAQASQRGGRAGSPNEGACPEVRAKQKTFTVYH